jgi:hypothetical protein
LKSTRIDFLADHILFPPHFSAPRTVRLSRFDQADGRAEHRFEADEHLPYWTQFVEAAGGHRNLRSLVLRLAHGNAVFVDHEAAAQDPRIDFSPAIAESLSCTVPTISSILRLSASTAEALVPLPWFPRPHRHESLRPEQSKSRIAK